VAIRFSAQLWAQSTDWPGFREAVLALEAHGWDGAWTWDHIAPVVGPADLPTHEGWSLLSAAAAVTDRIRLGLLVGANTLRHPALTAKLAVTLDHVSDGRAVLGLGAGWLEADHAPFGIPFGASHGDRIARLDEAVMLVRGLLDGDRVSHQGRYYAFDEAAIAPRPIQARLPILIGGGGLRRTLRVVAQRADAWNSYGPIAEMAERTAALERHCADVGRDPAAIERTTTLTIVLRATDEEARAVQADQARHNRIPAIPDNPPVLVGPPSAIAAGLLPYLRLGFGHIIVRLPTPYDHETIERIGELRDAVASAVGSEAAAAEA
jgi:alkanesulfonate monooxygenase SsuD/methylene tetrahydromethanopterin reductase-like flavin-dependent oxidoreductase (luciferase family)